MSAAAVLSALTPPVGVSAPLGDEGGAAPGLFSSLLDQANAQLEPASQAAARLGVTGVPSARQGLAFGVETQTPEAPQPPAALSELIIQPAPSPDLETPAAAAAPVPDVEADTDPALPGGLAITPPPAAATPPPVVLAGAMSRAAAPVASPSSAPDDAAPDDEGASTPAQTGSADDSATPPPVPGNAPSADRTRNLSAAAPSQSGPSGPAQTTDAASGETPAASKPGDNAALPAPAPGASPKPTPQPALAEPRPVAPSPPAPDAAPASPSGATVETSAPGPTRDLGLSQMSRAAIETTAQIAAQIVRRLEGRSTRFDMVLTPEDLGRVDVKLDIDSEGRLAARLAFDNPAAATDLRGRADELRRQLQDAGFQLAHDALDFSEREAGSGQMFEQRRERASAFSARARLGAEEDPIQATAWTPLSLTPRGVDLKV
jgi:flagellar hook-length control protein FliK